MEHLTPSEMIGYRRRKLSAEEMIAADDHLAACDSCRRLTNQCEQMVDTGAVLAELGDVHLSYEEIEGYIEERSVAETRRRIESHLELCTQCRREVDDLSEFQRQSKTWALPVQKRRPFAWFGGFPALAATFATVALVVVAIAWWWWNPGHRVPAPAVVALNDGPATGVPTADREAMDLAIKQGILDVPASIAALRGTRTVVRAPTTANGFELLSPLATAVMTDRPEFKWKPLAGASEYRVAIFATGFHKVAESPWIESTAWTATEPLERGRVYSWQVTARLGRGSGAPIVRAPALQDPEARLEVLDASSAAALERAAREHASSHLLMGTLYARAGVLDLAEEEFKALAAANPQSPEASALLEKIRAMRR